MKQLLHSIQFQHIRQSSLKNHLFGIPQCEHTSWIAAIQENPFQGGYLLKQEIKKMTKSLKVFSPINHIQKYFYIIKVWVSWVIAGASLRKVRTLKSMVVGNTHPGQPAGKCHRNETAIYLVRMKR